MDTVSNSIFCLFRLCQLKREDSESALLVDRDESEISKNFEMVRRESVKILLDKNFETRFSLEASTSGVQMIP